VVSAQQENRKHHSVTETSEKKTAKAKQTPRKAKSPAVKVIKKPPPRSPEAIEGEIATAEKLLTEISEQMGRPEVARDVNRFMRLSDDFKQAESSLRALYEEWEKVAAPQYTIR
jgi:hypothetical protein